MTAPRMTLATRRALGVLLDDPDRQWYGLELCEATGLSQSTIYPMLERLAAAGWLWTEKEESVDSSRPRRLYYRLSTVGWREAGKAVGSLRVQLVEAGA